MAESTEKACKECARSKRKCDKKRPTCRRCHDRLLVCHYPPAKISHFVPMGPLDPVLTPGNGLLDAAQLPVDLLEQPILDLCPRIATDGSDLDCQLLAGTTLLQPPPSLSSSSSSPCSPPETASPHALWFLDPETWKIDNRSGGRPSTSCDASLLRGQIADIQGWLARWVTSGSCPFVHAQLYRIHMPSCVQVAFAVLASYIHRTEATAEFVLHIVEEQARRLVVSIQDTAPETALDGLLEQLARAHALIVYQTIGLFDGDIRARHQAENRLGLLGSCANQLHEHAQASLTTFALSNSCATDHDNSAERAWYLWILSESIRRTWMVAHSIECIYYILQRGWNFCPGNVMYTTRQGLWDARFADEWQATCDSGHAEPASARPLHAQTADPPLLSHRFDCEHFFADAGAGDVDEFSRALMAITFGRDRVSHWERRTLGQQAKAA